MSIYLDNNATTPVEKEVQEAMNLFQRECFYNPTSAYKAAKQAKNAIEESRRCVAKVIGCDPSEIIFTSGGTESNNLALKGLVSGPPETKANKILLSAVEHPSIGVQALYFKKLGYEVCRINVDSNGRIDMRAFEKALTNDVIGVSVMWANNENGVIMPVEEIGLMAKGVGAFFHTDAVQAVGKIRISLKSKAIDTLSISAHKLFGPKGVGALYVRNGVELGELFSGGGQEFGRRSGTYNVPGIIGFGMACGLAQKRFDSNNQKCRSIRDYLEAGIKTIYKEALIVGEDSDRLPNTSNVLFKHLESKYIANELSKKDILVSIGSACKGDSIGISSVLQAINVPYEYAKGAIRFSCSHNNSKQDIDNVLVALKEVIDSCCVA